MYTYYVHTNSVTTKFVSSLCPLFLNLSYAALA